MPKGKKFDAAEKHFEKKRVEYQRTIDDLRKQLDMSLTHNVDLHKRCVELSAENEMLNTKVKCLLKLMNMSKAEVENIIDHNKKMRELLDLLMPYTGSIICKQHESVLETH